MLPCGHSVCSSCISTILEDNKVYCFTCHKEFNAISVEQFPLNYGVADLSVTDMEVDETPQALNKTLNKPKGLTPHEAEIAKSSAAAEASGLTPELFALKEKKLKDLVEIDARVQLKKEDLKEYSKTLKLRQADHMHCINQLADMASHYEEVMARIKAEEERVTQIQEMLLGVEELDDEEQVNPEN